MTQDHAVLYYFPYLCLCACVCIDVYIYVYYGMHLQSEDSLQELVLLLPSCNPRDWTQVLRLVGRAFTHRAISPALRTTLYLHTLDLPEVINWIVDSLKYKWRSWKSNVKGRTGDGINKKTAIKYDHCQLLKLNFCYSGHFRIKCLCNNI